MNYVYDTYGLLYIERAVLYIKRSHFSIELPPTELCKGGRKNPSQPFATSSSLFERFSSTMGRQIPLTEKKLYC
jgi:hypothetical protein